MARTKAAVLSAYFTANTSRFEQGTRRAGDSLKTFDKKIKQSQSTLKKYQLAIFSIGTAYAALNASRSLVNASLQIDALNSKMLTAVGATGDVAGELERLRLEANRLGVDFLTSANNFSSFAAAARAAGLEMDVVRDVFTQTSKAGVALRLSNDDMNGVFQALTQIAGKGVVSMEELRQQLGERIPLALTAMADGLGLTTAELVDLVSSGKLAADVGLKGLADGFRNNADLAAAFSAASDSTQASINILNNKIFELKKELVENTGIIPVFNQGLDDLSEIISDPQFKQGLTLIVQSLSMIGQFAANAVRGVGLLTTEISEMHNALKSFGRRNIEERPIEQLPESTQEILSNFIKKPIDEEVQTAKKTFDEEIKDLQQYALSKGKTIKFSKNGLPFVEELQGNNLNPQTNSSVSNDNFINQLKLKNTVFTQGSKNIESYAASIKDLETVQLNFTDLISNDLKGLADGYLSLRDIAVSAFEDILRSMLSVQQGGSAGNGFFSQIGGAIAGSLFGSPGAASIMTASNGASVPLPQVKPSFATGIRNVPYDMTARLHKGETVMTRQQSEVLKRNNSGVATYNIDARGAEAGVEQKIQDVLMRVEDLRNETPFIAVNAIKNANSRQSGFLS